MAARLPLKESGCPPVAQSSWEPRAKSVLVRAALMLPHRLACLPFLQINCRYEAPTDSDAPKVLLLSLRRCKKVQAQLQLAVPTRASEALLLHVLEKQRASPSARGINICLKHRGKQAWLATGWRAWHEGLGWISG